MLPDSAFKDYGWDYFGFKRSRFGEGTMKFGDTLINGIEYKRIKNDTTYTSSKGEKQYEITIGYLRCDKKGLPLYFENKQSQKRGCPITRVDIIIPKRDLVLSTQMEQIADTLTQAELNVFSAWERNAKRIR